MFRTWFLRSATTAAALLAGFVSPVPASAGGPTSSTLLWPEATTVPLSAFQPLPIPDPEFSKQVSALVAEAQLDRDARPDRAPDQLRHAGDQRVRVHRPGPQRLAAGEPVEAAYNLGSGDGLSVRQIMDAMARVTGIDFTPEIGPRRAGDPDRIVATGELAARDLDWKMRYSVDEMVRTGGEARRAAA